MIYGIPTKMSSFTWGIVSRNFFLSFLVFAVGLLVQSTDVLDPKLILTTSEEPVWSANCVSEQIARSNLNFHLPVAIGETLPPYSERGSVCGVPGLVGFALHDTCAKHRKDLPLPIPNGVEYTATMLEESDRDDWTYIAIGGQTSLQKLIRNHPEVLSKIRNIVAMGGNWCTGFEAYPDLMAPTDETNIGCDMAAANFVLEAAAKAAQNQEHFPAIHYVPLVTVNRLTGDDYALITDAALPSESNPHYNAAAQATIDFYKAWSISARSTPGILVYKEAMTFDPETESTPQFDAVAVMVAMEISRGTSSDRVAQRRFANGVHFVTNQEAALAKENPEFFKGNPAPAAYTLWSGHEAFLEDKFESGENNISPFSGRCQGLTPHHFDPTIVPPSSTLYGTQIRTLPPVAIQVALGFVSQDTEKEFFHEMALRISGRHAQPHNAEPACDAPISSTSQIEKAKHGALASTFARKSYELQPKRIRQNISDAFSTALTASMPLSMSIPKPKSLEPAC